MIIYPGLQKGTEIHMEKWNVRVWNRNNTVAPFTARIKNSTQWQTYSEHNSDSPQAENEIHIYDTAANPGVGRATSNPWIREREYENNSSGSNTWYQRYEGRLWRIGISIKNAFCDGVSQPRQFSLMCTVCYLSEKYSEGTQATC